MKVLPYSFRAFTAVGVWRPLSWNFGWKRLFYDCYTVFVLTGLYSYAFMEFIDSVQSIKDIQRLVDGSFMFVSVFNSCLKAGNMIQKRERLIDLLAVLDNNLCSSRNEEEEKIKAECSRRVKINFTFFFTLVGSAVTASTICSVFENIPERSLPFRIWVPFYNNSEVAYWILYFQEVVLGHYFQATIAIGNDTLVAGTMLLTCAQLKILKYRQTNFLKILAETRKSTNLKKDHLEKQLIIEMIQHHKTILKFAEVSNDLFSTVIFVQYVTSSYMLCMSVYRCSQMEITNPEYPFTIFFLMCITTQIFYFCWYGNEVILESLNIAEAIYKMDWTQLSIRTQKDLLLIMNRTTYPIIFTSGQIIVLDVESFKGIMKLSYTAFNVLQQSS